MTGDFSQRGEGVGFGVRWPPYAADCESPSSSECGAPDPDVDSSAGVHVYEAAPDPEAAPLMASLKQLTTQDRRHVAALVESLLSQPARTDGNQAVQHADAP